MYCYTHRRPCSLFILFCSFISVSEERKIETMLALVKRQNLRLAKVQHQNERKGKP